MNEIQVGTKPAPLTLEDWEHFDRKPNMFEGFVFFGREDWKATEPMVRGILRNLGLAEALRACSTETIFESLITVLTERSDDSNARAVIQALRKKQTET
jgi:hypothetical protein